MLDGTAWAAQRRVREMGEIECLADSVSFGVLVEIVDESVAWAEALRQELVA